MTTPHKQNDPRSTAMLAGAKNRTNTVEIQYHGLGSEVKLNAEVLL